MRAHSFDVLPPNATMQVSMRHLKRWIRCAAVLATVMAVSSCTEQKDMTGPATDEELAFSFSAQMRPNHPSGEGDVSINSWPAVATAFNALQQYPAQTSNQFPTNVRNALATKLAELRAAIANQNANRVRRLVGDMKEILKKNHEGREPIPNAEYKKLIKALDDILKAL